MQEDKEHINNLKALYYPDPFEANYIPHILKEMYIDRIYDRFLMGKKDLTVLDLGANIGLFSMFVARYAKRVVAIEPALENYQCLVKNVEGLKVDPYKLALTNESGALKLYHTPNKTAHNVLVPTKDFEEVKALNFEALLAETELKNVDLVKLDIEGAEFEVLGGPHFKKISSQIKLIVGEMHSWAGRPYSQIMWSLKDAGFNFELLNQTEASIFVAWRDK